MEKVNKPRLRMLTGLLLIYFIALLCAEGLAAETKEKAEAISFEVLNPEGEMKMASDISIITPRVKDLSTSKIGLIWAGKSGGEFFLDALEVILK